MMTPTLGDAAMAVRHMRLGLGVFFLVAGGAVLVLRFGVPDLAARINSPERLVIGGVLGLVLGGLNLARWYAGMVAFENRATPVRPPLLPDPTASTEPEYNPEFDFGKADERP
jgi:hypothetical protein